MDASASAELPTVCPRCSGTMTHERLKVGRPEPAVGPIDATDGAHRGGFYKRAKCPACDYYVIDPKIHDLDEAQAGQSDARV